MRHFARQITLALLFSSAMAAPAMAELPPEIAKLIADSRASGNAEELAAVVAAAKRLYPGDAGAIDVLAAMEPHKAQDFAKAAPPPAPTATPTPTPTPWKGKGEVSGFLSNGNTDAFGVALVGELVNKGAKVQHKWATLIDYQESANVLSREYARFGYQVDWAINPKHYTYARAEYEHDRTAGVEHRGTIAVGYGWRVSTEAPLTLNLEAGPAYRRTVFYSGLTDNEIVARGVLDMDWLLTPAIKLTEDAETTYGDSETVLRSITGLEAKLTGRLSGRMSYDIRHSTEPQPGKKATDTTARIGVVYDF